MELNIWIECGNCWGSGGDAATEDGYCAHCGGEGGVMAPDEDDLVAAVAKADAAGQARAAARAVAA